MSDEHYKNVRCDKCGNWASACKCDEQSELPASAGSDLIEALDDGQEVELYKLDGRTKGYVARIFGDCWCESDPHPTLDAAIKDAATKYKEWKTV